MIVITLLAVIVLLCVLHVNPMLTPCTYQFFHANIFHMLANGLALYTIFRPGRKDNIPVAALSYLISVLVFPLSHLTPIGISNMLYAAIGMRTPPFSNRWWTAAPTWTFHAVTILMLLIPHFSAVSHIYSYIMGICAAIVIRFLKDLSHEEERAVK